MKATQLAIATAVVTCLTVWSGYALATQPGNNGGGNGGCGVGQQTNGCGSQTPGNGGAGGQGGNGTGIGLGVGVGIGHSSSNSNSSANSASGSYSSGGDAKATGGNSNATGGAGGSASTNQAQSASGYGGTANGQGSGNTTSVSFEGGTYKEAAQTAYAAPVYIQPFEDCRIYVSLGGSSRDGSASGGIPLGNSAACLRKINKLQMLATNKEFPGTYTKDDFLQADCSVEGMEKMAACKK